ncbi:hypothetical protein Lser_V15G03249 [Lactuca serriola]
MSSSRVLLELFKIPLKDIILATQNFAAETLIGNGGFGTVYKGQLSELWQNRSVDVQRLDRHGRQGHREFLNEVSV